MEESLNSSVQNSSVQKSGVQKSGVQFKTISADADGQRIDNYLFRELKGVPKSHIYRILRKGEVRVNKKRTRPTQKLHAGDVVRIPPVRTAVAEPLSTLNARWRQIFESSIVLEDENLVAINKPSGVAVHGGSGIDMGLIEAFRLYRPELDFAELVHRIDRDTSGLVLLAKNRPGLLEMHELLQTGGVDKRYLTMVAGCWRGGARQISHELVKKQGGRRNKIQVGEGGKLAQSIVTPLRRYHDRTLLEVRILTGRMHQIRTQLAHMGLPVIGDDRYGDFALNRRYNSELGIKRLFLHAAKISFRLPLSGRQYRLTIPLADDLKQALNE